MSTTSKQTVKPVTDPELRSQGLSPNASLHPADDLIDYAKAYARQRPEVAALWCFGIGFVVGWKLKPW